LGYIFLQKDSFVAMSSVEEPLHMNYIRQLIGNLLFFFLRDALLHPKIMMHVLPGGKAPERKTDGAIGYDAFARAIVSGTEMDQGNPLLRKTIFDFERTPTDVKAGAHIVETTVENRKTLGYVLHPGESVLVGIGFVTAMPFPLLYWVAPRSGLASKHKITVTNAPGTVDPDYRGEAGVLIHNRGETDFIITKDMRIVQTIYQWAIIPKIEIVPEHSSLPETLRGVGGFGSTGLH
jgi:dUTP pyrophosphatase